MKPAGLMTEREVREELALLTDEDRLADLYGEGPIPETEQERIAALLRQLPENRRA